MNSQSIEDHWLFQFINKRGILKKLPNKTISIFSVNGDRISIRLNRSDFKIFHTIENVHVPFSKWQKYEDLLLEEKSINLSLGFDLINHDKYLRFPYWIMTTFHPEDDFSSIKHKCEILNSHNIHLNSRNKFCSFICRKDYFGDREKIYNQISTVGRVDCDGEFLHNNDNLKVKFNDNKLEFLKSYKFNLCPENTNYEGYVTEKIFDAIYSGCIPIYWGSGNNPEPEILNQSAILFFNNEGDNSSLLTELNKLNHNPSLYKKFSEQNRLNDNAPELIYNYYVRLENKLREIVQ